MVTNCEDWASRFRSWTNFGFSNQRRPSLLGTNAKLSEYAAAVALGSIDEFDEIKERLFQIQEEARAISSSIGFQAHPAMRKGLVSPYWILDFETSNQKQSALNSLTLNGIESRDWWERGCHNEGLFGKTDSYLPITNSLASTTLGVPMHLNLTGTDLGTIKRSLEVKL
jgi:dTDP-4-amino-4,6-dideoxygalactose transaminase